MVSIVLELHVCTRTLHERLWLVGLVTMGQKSIFASVGIGMVVSTFGIGYIRYTC